MFELVYNTFQDHFKSRNTIDDILTSQTLFCDMVIRVGTLLEELAGICVACKEFSLHATSIAETFLAYSDPISFYTSVSSKKGSRIIKQIYKLPESKGDLDKLFKNLTIEEKNLLWKGVQITTKIICEEFSKISQAIVRRNADSLTIYDMYNKLKHGYSPQYNFILPVQVKVETTKDIPTEELIKKVMIDNFTFMHDKLPGQRTQEEKEKFEKGLATPALTSADVTIESAKDLRNIVKGINDLYKRIVATYSIYSEGIKNLVLLGRPDLMSEDEKEFINKILNDNNRYI